MVVTNKFRHSIADLKDTETAYTGRMIIIRRVCTITDGTWKRNTYDNTYNETNQMD